MTRNAIVVTVLAVTGWSRCWPGRCGWGAGPSRRRCTPLRRRARHRSTSIAWCARIRTTAKAFTQGLVYRDGVFYESTGLYGESSLRKVAIETGEVLRRHDVDAQYFAEGLSEWGETLVQLTWTTGVAFAYDRETFKEVRRFAYTGEGWGLTRTDRHLVMSDGSATLKLLDPSTFAQVSTLEVRDEHGPVTALNELEMVQGVIFANVWQSSPHRDDRAGFGNGDRMAGPDRSAAGIRARSRRCPQRHRVR